MTAFPWIDTLTGAAAVETAARMGILDGHGSNRPGLLVGCLVGLGVLRPEADPDGPGLTPGFAAAWRDHRADILARARFYCRAAADVAGGLDDLFTDLPAFMERSATFRLFRYDKALGTDPESLAATAEWVDYLEALSRTEIPHLLPDLPFGRGDRVLEIGGNTGLFAAAIGAATGAEVTVLDLPAVCALGRRRRPGLRFVAGDGRDGAQVAAAGQGARHVLFKSVLHDWPDPEMARMLGHAADLVPPGGTVVICERAAPRPADLAAGSMQAVANLVFAPFYRGGEAYRGLLAARGFAVETRRVEIDMEFEIVIGRRP